MLDAAKSTTMSAELALGGGNTSARHTIHPGWVRVTHWINAIAILAVHVALALLVPKSLRAMVTGR